MTAGLTVGVVTPVAQGILGKNDDNDDNDGNDGNDHPPRQWLRRRAVAPPRLRRAVREWGRRWRISTWFFAYSLCAPSIFLCV